MLNNQRFLKAVLDSFKNFISSGTSRSTAKLKPLHGAIAADLANRLGTRYKVAAQGYGDDKEQLIAGRYIDKKVDITVQRAVDGQPLAGIAVKFVMQNYSQNSNNYFENMLGETANIRCAHVPYFQIFIILDHLPYYKNNGELSKWEDFTEHNMQKYCALANDNPDMFQHTPNKTLIYVVHIAPESDSLRTKAEYLEFYTKNNSKLKLSRSANTYPELVEGGTIVLNDYETFVEKVYHYIKSL